jgi:nitrite reductase/ring-hydroxylating ferredoxin subunit
MISRRKVISSALGVSAALTLSACTPEVSNLTPSTDSQSPPPTSSGPIEVCKVGDVAVGSGKRFEVEGIPILITQPRAGEFRAFSAICTHAGFVIGRVANSEIICDNHGAVFNADDGSVIKGPAARALGKITVEVSGDSVLVSF